MLYLGHTYAKQLFVIDMKVKFNLGPLFTWQLYILKCQKYSSLYKNYIYMYTIKFFKGIKYNALYFGNCSQINHKS